MKDTERTDFLIGQVSVLKAAIIALVIKHPEPEDLLKIFERGSEHTISNLLPTVASEAMLEGVDDMRHTLLHILSSEVKKKSGN